MTAWRALLDDEPENRRAQDALRKLYLQQRDWDALESFYAAQGKWDEFVRVLERQAEAEDDKVKVGLFEQDRRAVPRSPQQAGPGAAGLRAGAAARSRQSASGRGADPDLRAEQGRGPPGGGADRAAGPHHAIRAPARS